jgi:hypothetical protein
MKQRILLTVAIAGLAATGYGVFAQACDKDKASTATARTSARPNSYLVSTESSCSAHKNSAAVASMSGDHCAKGHGASAAVAAGDCCLGKHGNASAVAVAGFGGAGHQSCTGKGMAQTADVSNHADCDACADMAACAEQLRTTGSQTQVMPLKNGVMFVYTADSPSRVRAVQSAVAHRTERLTAMTVAGDKAHLCPECKNIRGAIASGKLNRETVNIEGGCLTLMTSDDPAMVSRLRAMAGLSASRHVKS